MTFTFRKAGTGDVIPVASGTYTATLSAVDEREGGYDNKGFRIWHFLADVDGTLTPVDGLTGKANSDHPKNVSYQWLTAILGEPPQLGVPINPIGSKCLVVVSQKDGYPRVSEVLPYREPQQVLPGVPR